MADPAGGWIVDDDKWTVDDYVRLCQVLTLKDPATGRTEQFGCMSEYWLYWLPFHMGGLANGARR